MQKEMSQPILNFVLKQLAIFRNQNRTNFYVQDLIPNPIDEHHRIDEYWLFP